MTKKSFYIYIKKEIKKQIFFADFKPFYQDFKKI